MGEGEEEVAGMWDLPSHSLLANPGLKVDKELGQLEKTLDPKE